MSVSKFEEGLNLLERAIPLLRQAFAEQEGTVRQAIIDAINGGGQIRHASSAKPSTKGKKAPKGAAEAAARAILRDRGRATWATFEQDAEKHFVSFSALKKAVHRLKEAGAIRQEGYTFMLK
ncbi:MAG TPA: hypothetical protein VMF58_02055 [Rhizomicrobium sp.]|nr:hypothetical protein [Rhizomicrobium sp.]